MHVLFIPPYFAASIWNIQYLFYNVIDYIFVDMNLSCKISDWKVYNLKINITETIYNIETYIQNKPYITRRVKRNLEMSELNHHSNRRCTLARPSCVVTDDVTWRHSGRPCGSMNVRRFILARFMSDGWMTSIFFQFFTSIAI